MSTFSAASGKDRKERMRLEKGRRTVKYIITLPEAKIITTLLLMCVVFPMPWSGQHLGKQMIVD